MVFAASLRNVRAAGFVGRHGRRALLPVAVVLILALLPMAPAAAVVEPGDPIVNLTPNGDNHALSGSVDVSADGNLVVFVSDAANLTADPDNGWLDVFLTDRTTGITVNLTAAGNQASTQPRISADGSTVVFVSSASNLTTGTDSGTDRDVFSYHVASGVTTRISPESPAGQAERPELSADGSIIVLRSTAVLAGPPASFPQRMYVWQGGAFTYMTTGSTTARSASGAISDDGLTAYFSARESGASTELWEWDVASATATFVTLGSLPRTNDDGTILAFSEGNEAHYMDRNDPAAPITTVFPGDNLGFALSGDGEHFFRVPFVAGGGPIDLEHYDAGTGVTTTLLANRQVRSVASSHEGGVIGFESDDPTLTSDPDNGFRDVYVMFESVAMCEGFTVTVDLNAGQSPTTGDDVILGTSGPDLIDGLGGNDIICGEDGDDTITGGDGDDTIYGSAGDDILSGGDGDDELSGWDGADTLDGGAGNDEMRGGDGNDTLRGGVGNDQLRGFTGDDVLYGDIGADAVYGGFGMDEIYGGPGNDRLFGQQDNDRLYGDDGSDRIYGGSEDDLAHGGAGDDRLWGQSGNDTLNGDAGDDWALGSGGNDVLNGGDGNDLLYGSSGLDTIDGGPGLDRLYGQSGDDNMFGGPDADDMYAGPGADTVFGEDGDDRIWGQTGNDVLNGDDGNDEIRAGTGVDTLNGDAGADYLAGGDHRDFIYGGAGDDELLGGDGNDDLSGGDGDDLLRGQLDNDDLSGGLGTDVCNGGLGLGDSADQTCEDLVAVP